MLPTVAGALAGMQFNFIGLFRAAPIATPLLMFGVMIGSLFVVTRLSQQRLGVLAALRLHVHRRADADADPDGRCGFPQRRPAGSRFPAD
jgi:hypothetical protein